MKSAVLLAVAATAGMLAGAGLCPAQDVSTPPPPPPPVGGAPEHPDRPSRDGSDKDKDRHRSGGRPASGSGSSGFGGGFSRGDRDRGDMFKALPEEERQKVRVAFEKAWQDPEVIAARDRMFKANEEMRSALHNALKKADPDVVRILEKIRPPGGFPGMARMPDPGDPEFASQAVHRLAGELQAAARLDRREVDTRPMHERIILSPAVKEAIQRVKDAPVEQRPEAWRRLQDAYRGAARTEFVQAWGKSPWEKDRDRDRERGPSGPGGDGPGPGPGPGFGGDIRERGERPPPPPRPEGEGAPKAPQ